MKTTLQSAPEYAITVHDPKIGMTGFLVIDNTAIGPGKGGIRMTSNVTLEEVARLANTMTWKNSLAGIPFGGAKGGIVTPAGISREQKKQFVQSFARALKPFLMTKYIGGPDVNSGENEMMWFAQAVGIWSASTGKPSTFCAKGPTGQKMCGLPHELGSTGFGVAHSTAVAAKALGINLKGARIAIHGFGNVGTFAYQFLTEMGATIVALADKSGAVHSASGFPEAEVKKVIAGKKTLLEAFKKHAVQPESFWSLPVDILIPASVTDVINDSNKHGVRAKLIIEAGNIPMQERIEEEFFRKGIFVLPDFVANAGGVISSYAEYKGYGPQKMFTLVKGKIIAATEEVMKRSLKKRKNPREVAMELARERVEEKMTKRKATFA